MKVIGSLHAGVARIDITPPVGHIIHSGDKVSEGVADPLFAKALVFSDGGTHAALITVDLIMVDGETVAEVRQRVALSTPIPGDAVMIAASHTHGGPPTTRWLSSQMSASYIEELVARMATAVVEAWRSLKPCRLGAGTGESKLSVNRWMVTPEGARWGVAWDEPTDNSVNVLRVDDMEGKPFAAVVNFASHGTVVDFGSNRLYTGDYPSHLQSTIERRYPGLTALFTNGAAGDLKIAFVNDEGDSFAYGGIQDARRFGSVIGEEAARVLAATATRPVEAGLLVASAWPDLPLQAPPTEQDLCKELDNPEYPFWSELWARGMLSALGSGPLPKTVRAEVQVLRLGDVAALVGLPGEAFVEIGLRLKREFARRSAVPFVVGYANGYCGYLPSARSVRLDGVRPRYNWHKIVGYPAVYDEPVEDVLFSASVEAYLSGRGEGAGL